MKRYFAILTMMVLAVAACQKQGPVEGPVNGGEVITAHIGGPDSKVEFDPSSGAFSWNTPDYIAIHTTEGEFKKVEVNSSGVFTFYPNEGEERDGYAFYPDNVAAGTVDAPSVTLPASYDLDELVTGNRYPTPMIAVNNPDDADLWFYHLGGALRLTLDGVPEGTTTLSISMGKGITGTFAVADPNSNTPSIAPAATADEVSFTLASALEEDTDGLVINIPLPAGAYPKIFVAAKDEHDAVLASIGSYKDWTFPRTRARKVTINLQTSLVSEPHPFSVSPSRTVSFSPGNLQYVGGSYKFADAQYEFIGYQDDNNCDLLPWRTTAPDSEIFADWTDVISGGWSTLSTDEFRYLLGDFEYLLDNVANEYVVVAPVTNFGRNGGNPHALRAFATIYTADAAIEGLLILPDDWTTAPEGCREVVCGRWEASEDAVLDNTYNAGGTAGSSGDWDKMEAAGAVFLPLAGCYANGSVMPGFGVYWSATHADDQSSEVITWFFNDGLHFTTHVNRSDYGCSVRLVKDFS